MVRVNVNFNMVGIFLFFIVFRKKTRIMEVQLNRGNITNKVLTKFGHTFEKETIVTGVFGQGEILHITRVSDLKVSFTLILLQVL
jgi:hypothetical protein